MKRKYNYSVLLCMLIFSLFGMSCSEDLAETGQFEQQGTPLTLGISFGPSTRLSELGNSSSINDSVIGGKNYGLNNVGLYIYYTDDYNKGDLSQPYVRNLECNVDNGKLLAVLNPGDDPAESRVFIYDRMTVVAFYPYNAEMSDPANYFQVKSDEEKYPITRNDYSEQYYIPYRAQTQTDPTRAYFTELILYPKHTYKLEVVVVSDDTGDFPSESDIMLLPNNDSITNPNPSETEGKREAWFDKVVSMDNGGGGSHVRQYVGYIWTKDSNRNDIKKGDVLLKSGKLTLIASTDVSASEQYVYRYGYNMSTGEIFIPTSSNLIHDVPTLKGMDKSIGTGYQVCDIDMSVAGNWTPIHLLGGRYDGGGHKLTDMNISSADSKAGLFGQVQGNTIVSNVNLIDPVITINSTTTDTCYVGSICGKLNNVLSEEDRAAILANLPPNLSEVVKEQIIKELLASTFNTISNIVGCRVENPTIVVNAMAPRVGTIVGQAGDKEAEGTYKSRIWDSYSLDGSIQVNASAPAHNVGAYVGGFVGLNQGLITRSFTTIDQVTAQVEETVGEVTRLVDIQTGFSTMGTYYSPAEGGSIEKSFSILTDPNAGVQQFPGAWPSGWVTYTGIWPINYVGWLSSPATSFWYNVGSAPTTYPTLQWQRR